MSFIAVERTAGTLVEWLTILVTAYLALFPLVQYLRENRRAILLPGHNEPRLVRIGCMLNVTEDQDPSVTKVLVKFAAGANLGRQFCFLNIQI
jgi:hypothetical protein